MRKTSTLFLASLLSVSAFSQNRGLNFDGINDYVSLPEKTGVITGNAFTFETWVKLTGPITDLAPILRKSNNYTGLNVLLVPGDEEMMSPERLQVDISTSVTYTSLSYELPASWTNQWHHVAVTYSGTVLQLFIDGLPAGPYSSIPITGTLPLTSSPVYLGLYSPSYLKYLNGTLDEARFWNVARTQAQIQASMNSEISATTANLTAYYRFNQGALNGNNTAITLLSDHKATPNNGTLFNFAKTGSASNFTNGYSSLVTLPIKEASFTAAKKEGAVQLGWKGLATQMTTVFEIERSANGTEFSAIGVVNGTASSTETDYSFTDAKPLPFAYYRLRSADANRHITYSKTIAVKINGSSLTLQAYPNPASATLQLQLTAPKGKVEVQIKDVSGRTVQAVQIASTGTTVYTSLDISRLGKGCYTIIANNESTLFIKQ